MAATAAPAPLTRYDVLLQACADTALHLARVRGTSFEAVARRDLEAMTAMLLAEQ